MENKIVTFLLAILLALGGWNLSQTFKLSNGKTINLWDAHKVVNDKLILNEEVAEQFTETERAIQANLAKIPNGKTAIVIAHRLSTIRFAHRILVLKGGKVAEEGNHDYLIKNDGTYADLWNIQSGDLGAHHYLQYR